MCACTYTRFACLLCHGRNAVGDKLRVTTLLNSRKLFTKLSVPGDPTIPTIIRSLERPYSNLLLSC